MPKALVIPAHPDNLVTVQQLNGLHEYQGAVGGYIEAVTLREGEMYVNEEGRLLGLPQNPRATALAAWLPDPIVGTAILFGPLDDDGNETDVSEQLVKTLLH